MRSPPILQVVVLALVLHAAGLARAAPPRFPAGSAGSPGVILQRTDFGPGFHVVLSAVGDRYPRNASVTVRVRVWNSSGRDLAFRWKCHRFAQLHFVSSRKDLGPAPSTGTSGPCRNTGGTIGILRPHHQWSMAETIRLERPAVAAQLIRVLHNVDGPGQSDVPILTRALRFVLT